MPIMSDLAAISGWERVALAVEQVRDRLRRAVAALEGANVPYAVIGGNAVAEWVGRVDQAAVRNTRDVDILLRRADFDAAKAAMTAAGFIYRHAASIDMFLDGKGAKARDAVHVIFASEKVRPEDVVPTPDVTDSEPGGTFRVLGLEALVRMKLIANRLKDQVHLQDMLEVGLIDATWPARFPPELAARLQHVLDTPDGLPVRESR
jgi:putative nucleotidyltransferase-like protein